MEPELPIGSAKNGHQKQFLMRILWIVNQLFPDVTEYLSLKTSLFGGWTFGLAHELKKENNIELHVATVDMKNKMVNQHINGITYHILRSKINKIDYDKTLEIQWKKLVAEVEPDLVHIHGTEYAHGLALIKSCPKLLFLVSIQGLVSVCARYYLAGIKRHEILKYSTFRDWVRWDTILHAKKRFEKRGKIEIEYIKRTNAVMGRTDWDFAHTKAISPDVAYYYGNETLRSVFYKGAAWKPENVEKHTIFLSQASYPLKGLHVLVKAISLLKTDFPNIQVRIAGGNILDKSSFSQRVKFTGYGNYISRLSDKFGVKDKLKFLGVLSAEAMIHEYTNSSVFVCPSSIENSPNSLAEAQILGVPVIASFVGGNHNMVTHGVSGLLYRFEEHEILAVYLRKILSDREFAEKLGQNGKVAAEKRHNPRSNVKAVMDCYQNMLNKK